MQLELPGDSRFSAPSTICAMAHGTMRALDPRILTNADFTLAAVPKASQHAFKFSSPCELDALANASIHPIAATLAAATRRYSRACLGIESHRLLGVTLRTFAAAREACGAPASVADAIVDAILRFEHEARPPTSPGRVAM